MKKMLSMLLLAAPLAGYCGDKGKLSGPWKEVSRKKGKETVSYTDTIMIKFLVGNEYVWQKQGGFIYRGSYKVESNMLDLGMRMFTIVERSSDRLVLRDDVGTYELVPYVEQGIVSNPVLPEKYTPVANVQQMAGHWSKFKATNANTREAIDYSRQIKMVDIFPQQKDGKWGNFYAGKDADNAPSWYIKSYANQTIYLEGKDSRQFKVIKCEKNELIMEEDGTTYFFRQFN